MQIIPRSVEQLTLELAKLPGIGPRTAERLTFHMLRADARQAEALGMALGELHAGVQNCRICHNFASDAECVICTSSERQTGVIVVVEEPFDVVAVEKTGLYHGRYHVLGGVISPIDGIGPDQLEIASLIKRLGSEAVTEIILATNPSAEGDATAMYIRQQLEGRDLKVTRLARGLPVGGDLEYADQITLGRALQGRQSF